MSYKSFRVSRKYGCQKCAANMSYLNFVLFIFDAFQPKIGHVFKNISLVGISVFNTSVMYSWSFKAHTECPRDS